MKTVDQSKFADKKEMHKFLVENKEVLMAAKKAQIKHGDVCHYSVDTSIKGSAIKEAVKANEPIDTTNLQSITVLPVINTTNLLDGHDDVHIPGLWKKTLSENKMIMHLQEHRMAFDKIISDRSDLKAFTRNISWSDLGESYAGETEALMFESVVLRKRNEFMFDQYAAGYVNNHSVGMYYVNLVLAINDEGWGAEFEMWEKYFPMVANKEDAEAQGYFWAIKEAKIIEGSAVPLGSNWVTPTLDNNLKLEPVSATSISEPAKATPNDEPSDDTRKRNYLLNLLN